MKHPCRLLWGSLALVALVTTTGCSQPVLDYRNAEVSDGLIYARGANEPFSGTVTHVPDDFMINGEGQGKFMRLLGGAEYETARLMQAILGESSTTYLCTISARKGYVDGMARCYRPQTDTQTIEAHFVKGELSGKFIYYNPDKPGQVLGEGTFEDGQPDGLQKIYSPATGKLKARIPWSHGQYDGDYATYNTVNGNVILKGAFAEGKRDGTWKQYAVAGKPLIVKETYSHGLLNGVQEIFDPDTGQRTTLVDRWVEGRINGTRKLWDKNGVLVGEEVYADGVLVKHDAPSTSAVDALKQALSTSTTSKHREVPSDSRTCVDDWVKAHRKVAGEDAAITADQLSEWQEWCSQGKSAPR